MGRFLILCGSVLAVGCADPCGDGQCMGDLVLETMPDGTVQADIVGASEVLPEGFEIYPVHCEGLVEVVPESWWVEDLGAEDWPVTLGVDPEGATRWSTWEPTIESGRRYIAQAWIPYRSPARRWATPEGWSLEFHGDEPDVDLEHLSCPR